MNFSSVSYRDSYIYIFLTCVEKEKKRLAQIKSVYIYYTLRAFHCELSSTVLIKGKNICVSNTELRLKLELQELHFPEDTEIELTFLQLNFTNSRKERIEIEQTYFLTEIYSSESISFQSPDKNQTSSTKFPIPTPSDKTLQEPSTYDIASSKLKSKLQLKKVPVSSNGLFIIEDITPIPEIVAHVDNAIEQKLSGEIKKLELDIKRLSFEAIDLLLTNLPKPESNTEFMLSKAMMQSIHKYIEVDLLQNEQEDSS